jgi:hypothetical protein
MLTPNRAINAASIAAALAGGHLAVNQAASIWPLVISCALLLASILWADVRMRGGRHNG